MRYCRNAHLTLDEAGPEKNRKHGRLVCREIVCSLGPVLDISRGGMRVLCEHDPRLEAGTRVCLHIQNGPETTPVAVRVAWVKKTGWRKRHLGMEFTDLTPAAADAISAIARGVVQNGFMTSSNARWEAA